MCYLHKKHEKIYQKLKLEVVIIIFGIIGLIFAITSNEKIGYLEIIAGVLWGIFFPSYFYKIQKKSNKIMTLKQFLSIYLIFILILLIPYLVLLYYLFVGSLSFLKIVLIFSLMTIVGGITSLIIKRR